ncbi:Replication factor A protein 1 [Coemansia sp. RSA 552]|nr:Replication factor A protein 1 [Coemansia sp. RSA 552]
MELSAGEIARLKTLDNGTQVANPFSVQIISAIQPFGNTGPMRYRCMVSDGEQSIVMVMPTSMSPLVDRQEVSRFTVLKITRCSFTKKPRPNDAPMSFIIVGDAEVVGTATEKLGRPERTTASAQPAEQKPQPPQPQPQQQQQQFSAGGQSSSFMSRVGESTPSAYAEPAYGGAAGGSAPVHQGAAPILHPIKDLNPYHSKWTIRARVTQKSGIRSWNKPTSQGRLFSVNLLDETGEIRATGFTQVVDRLYPMFEVGKVYYVSNAQVKMARQQFSNVNNQYELTFGDDTQVELCTATAEVPQEQFNFVPLGSLGKFEKGNIVDVLCVVRQVGDVSEFTPKSGAADRKMTKRDLLVVDKSGYQVRATLWGQEAKDFGVAPETVVAFKGMRVGDFGGRTLSLPSIGTMTPSPDIPEAHMVRGWYDSTGRDTTFQTFDGGAAAMGSGGGGRQDEPKTMAQVRDENLGGSTERADFFTVKGTVTFIRSSSLAYPGCASADCQKKVIEDTSGQWACERCAKSFAAPDYRYVFSVNVCDFTGQNWLQCFNETGEQLLGCSANEMVELQRTDEAAFERRVAQATFRDFNFRCKARSETFNEQVRVRYTIMGLQPVDYVAEAQRLSKLIEGFNV